MRTFSLVDPAADDTSRVVDRMDIGLRCAGNRNLSIIYEVDPLVCPRCGGSMRIIAFITEPRVVHTILRHLEAKSVDPRAPPRGGGAAA